MNNFTIELIVEGKTMATKKTHGKLLYENNRYTIVHFSP